jgi:hypothetical protein
MSNNTAELLCEINWKGLEMQLSKVKPTQSAEGTKEGMQNVIHPLNDSCAIGLSSCLGYVAPNESAKRSLFGSTGLFIDTVIT